MPRTVRLDEIKLINGSLDITGVSGEVHASCINGRLEAHDLVGRAELSQSTAVSMPDSVVSQASRLN